jgi:nucleoid-associated protein YejK
MDLYLDKIIIHELEKAADSGETQLFLSDRLIPINNKSDNLLRRLNDTFISKSDLLHGSLSSPEDALFPGHLQLLADQGYTEEAFIIFSKETMQTLQQDLEGTIGAKGGYFVYTLFEQEGVRILSIFLVRDAQGIVFQKNLETQSFELSEITHIDTSRLAMACRIQLQKFQTHSGRFVDLIRHGSSQKVIAEYFTNWVGLDEPQSSKAMTETFLHVVDKLPLPISQDTGQPMEEEEFRNEVRAFATQSPQKTIELDKFDQHFYGEESITQNYLRDNQIPLDNEVRVDKGALKRHYTYRASADGLSVSFSKNDYATGRVSIKGDNLVIDCPELIEKIMLMLEDDGTW